MALRSPQQLDRPADDQIATPVALAPTGTTHTEAPATRGVGRTSIIASIAATFLVRVAGQGGYVILGTFLSNYVTKNVAAVAFTLSGFYITELLLAPVIGTWSDKRGRKPFLLASPVSGALAILFLAAVAFAFANPQENGLEFAIVLGAAFVGRLMQGASTALNAPSSLGYLADVSVGSEKLRGRVMTAFEVATVVGIALGASFGNYLFGWFGKGAFFAIAAIYGLATLIISALLTESLTHDPSVSHTRVPFKEYLRVVLDKRILTFCPAWLAINAIVGAWLNLMQILLRLPNAYTTPKGDADIRFPHQLLHGGFDAKSVGNLLLAYGAIFILGMVGWSFFLTRFRRTTIMFLGIVGLVVSSMALWAINALGENPQTFDPANTPFLIGSLVVVVVGIMFESGFTPAALTHLAAISEHTPEHRGTIMGLYSVLLGVGQLLGVEVGGIFAEFGGFNGLIIFSLLLAAVSFGSVAYMRMHNHDALVATH